MAANDVSMTRVVSEDQARIEADRLLADPRLHVSDRHRAFLKYIVDALFEGRADTVKAYSIAIDVFNRPASFDPSSDPIVRIEATRLRETLQKYYEQIADEPGARLDIPRGRYVPVFVERDHAPCPEGDDGLEIGDGVQPEVVRETTKPDAKGWRYAFVGGAAVVAVAVASGLSYIAATPSPMEIQKPFLRLYMNTADKDSEAGAGVIEDLAMSLARFGTVRLRSDAAEVAAVADESAQSSYDVKMRYSESLGSMSIWWQIADAESGEAVWTDEERRAAPDGSREQAMRDLVYGLSRRLAGPVGVINAMERKRTIPMSALGNLCVLRGEYAVELRDPAALKASRPCLESTIAANPSNSDAMATLARIMVWTGRLTGDDSYFARGLDLASRAATVSPSSSRAALAQMATQYQLGQNETAIAAGRRGVALNPENADLLAKLSMVVFLSGKWLEGAEIARVATMVAGQSLRDASFVLILDAYRREDYAEAVFLARHVPSADTPTTVLKLAAIARIGDRSTTEKEIAAARMQHPDLDRTVTAMFSGSRYDRDLETALRAGMKEAGLVVHEIAENGSM